MKIGPHTFDNITVLAPLAGITNLPFRLLAKEAGCGLVCSEMVSANGIVRGSEKTLRLMVSHPLERPLSVQIFGSDPAVLADAAQTAENMGADILDINFGCPVRKVIRTGAGAALMRDPEKAEKIFKTVRKALRIPLTVKIRTGWENSGKQAFTIGDIAQACGVDAVILHPRTVAQAFGGRADWSLITALKRRLSIPVIGNGDVSSPEDVFRMRDETGCDGVMIGRAAVGSPWLFRRIDARLRGEAEPPVNLRMRMDTMLHYLQASVTHFGEKSACFMMRSRLGWFVKGLPGRGGFSEAIKRVSTEPEARDGIISYFAGLGIS
jgi:nifR3 family TIM-barrel protein